MYDVLILAVVFCCASEASEVIKPDLSPRIVGGENAKRGEFPWQILLQYFKDGAVASYCGGSIINNSTILTAAHCVESDPYQRKGTFMVTAGKIRLDGFERDPEAIDAESVVMHQRYLGSDVEIYSKRYKNDIALVILDTPLNFSRTIQPVQLSDTDFDTAASKSDQCFATGFGLTQKVPAYRFPCILQKANVDILPASRCVKKTYRFGYRSSPHLQVCNYQEGRSACNGDSGGPVGCYDDEGLFRQVGMVSLTFNKYGSTCINGLQVDTRVSGYLKWIQANIN